MSQRGFLIPDIQHIENSTLVVAWDRRPNQIREWTLESKCTGGLLLYSPPEIPLGSLAQQERWGMQVACLCIFPQKQGWRSPFPNPKLSPTATVLWCTGGLLLWLISAFSLRSSLRTPKPGFLPPMQQTWGFFPPSERTSKATDASLSKTNDKTHQLQWCQD